MQIVISMIIIMCKYTKYFNYTSNNLLLIWIPINQAIITSDIIL